MDEKGKVHHDPSSYSNPEECLVTYLKLNLDVNFNDKVLSGIAGLSVERKNLESNLLLDTSSLDIKNVFDEDAKCELDFILSEDRPIYGSKLEIKFRDTTTKKCNISIKYETSPKAAALNWLDAIQTAGKKQPYLFSHCQAIHARSIVPCQDTPSVKVPYSATVTAPSNLVVLMSAVLKGEDLSANDPLKKTFKFVQKIPIPSYLIAIAVGDLQCRKIGPCSHVWAEKEYVEIAAEEFSETETFLCTAEKLLGPYVWEVYDLLVLPPCFSYGGMEHPCITFLTPTILAGDKSLVETVIHEITHSWTGNLVTNSSSEHFWLNEGFTKFIERKIKGNIYGEPHRHFEALNGWKDLEYCVLEDKGEKNPLTKLVPDMTNIDPEDSFSSVPYEKGHTLLFYLEEQLGTDNFEKFLRAYIENFKYKSLDTDEWKSFLYQYFIEKKDILDKVDWDAWLYSAGMPPVQPKFDDSYTKISHTLCEAWTTASDSSLDQFTSKDINGMSDSQIREFLSLLLQETPLSILKVRKMKQVYGMDKAMNSEVRFRWLRLGLKAHCEDIIPDAIKFITEIGRMKFVVPIYRDLYEWGDTTRELAISTYRKNLPEMMLETSNAVRKTLKVDSQE